ncbi:hypothetical protein PPMP20_35150 [Paraburkholderia phymatum]|nr:hypothetical protein [Paraburkholderia phymatum]
MPLRTAIERVFASTDKELVALCTSHYSGYVREAAIGRAVELGGSTFLRPITERLNDWVPEIRNAAARALLTLLATFPAESFVPLLPRLRSLMQATRTDHRSWLLDIEWRLVQAGGTTAIVEAISGSDFHLRRAAYLVAIDHQLLPIPEIVQRGLLSGDIMLAKRAVALIDHLPVEQRSGSMAIAAAAPFGPVRHTAFKFVVSDGVGSENEPFLWRTIFDPQGSLRAAAARLLIERGRDVVERSSAMLDTGTLTVAQVRAGLSLLAELRARNATAMLTRFACDSRTQIRAHAVALLARVSPLAKDDIEARALLDSARRVRKAGVRLCTLRAFVSLEQIRTLLVEHRDRHAALTICARDQWDSLACIGLIALLETPSESGDEHLNEALRKWMTNPASSWAKPGIQHRRIWLELGVGTRLLELAGDRHAELRARLQEIGMEL